MECKADLLNTPLPMCYNAEFGPSALKGVGINIGKVKKANCAILYCCVGGVLISFRKAVNPQVVIPR